ncbi:MAG TPA: lysine 5,6-aminomutase subunit alpha [Bacilli bacterium]|nr:MAG: L-beta-lysine 5,6-aminomutase alpha subunit [Tenericutes bacterium ADurb.BinA124]HNZ50756.1 lysine 5,6-aminomutase subunit alpha [Bacilli bacterium]HPX84342.1 lysine 5,6-aminomutase subunit alpha [Bacilli bacterium]HQC74726.1 lysine 5,6-aminomutase subunit alpha [Bacilli bacterium]
MNKFNLDQKIIGECRQFATQIASDVQAFIDDRTTVAVERTVCRLLGIDGVDDFDVPIPNVLVKQVMENGNLSLGISTYLGSAIIASRKTLPAVIDDVIKGHCQLTDFPLASSPQIKAALKPYVQKQMELIRRNRKQRASFLTKFPPKKTEIYVIVATGNIYEDVIQAQAAAKAGADIIAIIRSTGQSLLDYVPYGATTEGFGGTYATQANFKIMRDALDEVSRQEKRYIKLVNYASGLCMPEIAAMAALERLDVLLNDSLYGIIFRDINMQRTLIDQYFSRRINAFAGIIINTGEDNYLTTADAFSQAHTVLASQFINEQLAIKAHLPSRLMGLGHAFEIDPAIENSFLYEVAQAQMAREIFPEAPLKYMPPTKHINGNIFRAYLQNAMFNMATILTNQSIHLLGMMTEAIHTPFMADRYLAIENAKMIAKAMKSLSDEVEYKQDGIMATRVKNILQQAHRLLKDIASMSLFKALEAGVFADVKRSFSGGKGLEGVFVKDPNYANVVMDALEEEDDVH